MATSNSDLRQSSILLLTTFGFTETEAAVYAFLVEHPPATAYRIAHAIGKPVANTYKAVDSLQRKGAVLVDSAAGRLCSAVPPDDLLRHLAEGFTERHSQLGSALSELGTARPDSGLFTLRSSRQVEERVSTMVDRARETILVDAFPGVIEWLGAKLARAAARGVRVAVRAYAPAAIEGVHVAMVPSGDTALQRWPGDWLCAVTDGSEYLLGYTGAGGALDQGLWSPNALLSWVQHSYMLDSIAAAEVERLAELGGSPEQLADAAARLRREFSNVRGAGTVGVKLATPGKRRARK